jgi:nicotinate-nucleotide adenylyltransferase
VTRRVGIFGGTFDPPHVGHLVTAVNVRHVLALDQVLLVVNSVPWQKAGSRAITGAEDRFAMVEAAVSGVAGLDASRIEIDRGGQSYTADTIDELLAAEPDLDLHVILGSDAAVLLPTWERVDDVRDRASVVIVDRPGDARPVDLSGWRWQRVEVPRLEVSSTDLRARVADGRPLDYLVPRDVVACIERRGLYSDLG